MAKEKEELSNANWEGMLKRMERERLERMECIQRGETLLIPLQKIHTQPRNDDCDERVYEIVSLFETSNNLGIEFTEMLDELKGYVESIDVAKELHSIDGLNPLLYKVMYNKHAGVRAKAAELISTMVHNNPSSQQLVMNVDGLQPLVYNFTLDPNATSRIKALGAIFSLIRNNKAGITAFRLENGGYVALKDALSSESVSLQRDALNLIHYLLHENSSDCYIVNELGLPCIMMHLASSDNAEVREAALRVLLVVTTDEEGGNSRQLLKNDDKLKQVLQERIEGISAMAPEDLGVAREERQLVDSLWNACYNEPSSLGEKGLLVLPGEDASDVASKLFEWPRRACAAAEPADRNSVSEKKEDPLLLVFGSPSAAAAAPTVQSNSSSKRKKSHSSSKRKNSHSSSKRKKSDSSSKKKKSHSSSKRKNSHSSSKRKNSHSSSKRKKSDSSS